MFYTIESDMIHNKIDLFQPKGIRLLLLKENAGVNTVVGNNDGTKLSTMIPVLHFLLSTEIQALHFGSYSLL
jgi:hypothetical protein